jgi:5-methyltetrahydrofolate--homocysteine methyltransferase
MDFIKRLNRERLIFDGSMGTMLQQKGLSAGELPELWNITNAKVVSDIHKAYVQAGCHILKANTFGANRLKLSDSGYSAAEVVEAGVALAREAAGPDTYIAMDIGPTGKLLAPFGDLEFEAAAGIFAEMVTAGEQAGADVILIETMGDTYEIKAAMLAAKERCGLPVLVTVTPDEGGRLLTGGDILSAVCLIEGLGADAMGFNCGLGPEQMKALLPELVKYTSIPVIINPNAGMPRLFNGKSVFPLAPEEFAGHMAGIAPYAQIIGGCCGTGPAHIAAMIAACKDIPVAPAVSKEYTAVSSYGKAVVFGADTVIIGERINPTGKPRMKQALREGDMGYLYSEGLRQIDHGAQILDVNAGLPDIDERAVLAEAVAGLQSITDTPLQIDTSDAIAAERALRLYNGKPLLNSVSGESLDTILPLVKKYGAAVIALTLDGGGIPQTAQGRVEIARKIIEEAERLGIPKKDIIVDALAMTISTDGDSARVTLDAMERIKRELGVHTVLGLSNISFGLPERGRINAAFFTLAMERGLSAGILNPMDAAMMDAFYAYRALSGTDKNCGDYIGRFSLPKNTADDAPGTPQDISLYDAVINGLRGQAEKAALVLCGNIPPAEIIDSHLIPALDKAGRDYQENRLYLPQLLMSAEAAGSAFEAIKSYMPQQEGGQRPRGIVVLATVKGDIHDIGKNIVKALLENYNFTVIDLGKNVEPGLVAETVLREQVKLVGLSALMTTTVVYMEETIKLLRQKAPDCLVMAGGAVLTAEYAAQIGADFYCRDAMDGVKVAGEVFG